MRSILFFDLPQVTSSEKRLYRHFVKDIKKLGFYMIQESVYVKMSIDNQVVSSISNKIKSIAPKKGNIMILNITEKQFSQIEVIAGESRTDVITSDERFLII